ncbi:MAG: ABC transporter substrate-binding protein [Acetobacteraceae bacterium]|nr:ABC transporter substrate-binding protein [Acetobacteraceae bacterium]
MRRRGMLIAGGGLLAAPWLGRGAAGAAGRDPATLRFIPAADPVVLDPHSSTAYATRNHALLVWDTLYGLDRGFVPRPQMAEGQEVAEGGRLVLIRLREGLRFHDGAPVLARDCVASIRRWAARDPLGADMLARLAALEAADDRTIRFRFRRPFGLLFEALGKTTPPLCAILPERLAAAPGPLGALIGSGPYRFLAEEHEPGLLVAYARFDAYQPRPGEDDSGTAGPKRAGFARIEWRPAADPAEALAAIRSGDADWWENPDPAAQAALRRERSVAVGMQDPLGFVALCRFNHLHPPFDSQAVRQAVLAGFGQAEMMAPIAPPDRGLWRDRVGFFPPGTPYASEAGLEPLFAPADPAAARRALTAAGYGGERIVVLVPTDVPLLRGLAQAGLEALRRMGFAAEAAAADWAALMRRRMSREPVSRGGWSVFFTLWAGADMRHPGIHQPLRAGGQRSWFGWPDSPTIEALREAWLDAADEDARRRIAADLHAEAAAVLPYVPLGQIFAPMAVRRDILGVQPGPPVFWNIRRG